ncbi:GFA family protein [Albidovulum sediminis]|uniref:GFA family protein n=1 Tax=Albidovulum sediminis TaxID=3066345 RepID=A0ABT2NHB0_9RHOB|nr:GFA family protein [Defluviimonas sediminis]MCT8328296.1 GFA family protein [Defluviimonas sediminis]
MAAVHKGTCFCGAVEIEAEGDPVAMGYCHCDSCRHWSAGPVNAFTLWDPAKVRVSKGAEFVGRYNKTPASDRQWCTRCGGHLMTGHPGLKLVDVYAALLPSVDFKPGVHVNYGETALRMKDGLPKFRDFPADFGGSGEMVAE